MLRLPILYTPETIEKQPIHDLYEDIYNVPDWTIEELGKGEVSETEILGMNLGDPDRPTIFMVATVHGTEWAAAYYALEFAKFLADPGDYVTDTSHVEYLRRKYNFFLIPVGCPWGYENNSRENANGVNINRDYRSVSQKETQTIIAAFNSLHPVAFLDCHEVQTVTDHPALFTHGSSFNGLVMEGIKRMRYVYEDEVVEYPALADTSGTAWANDQSSRYIDRVFGCLVESFRRSPTPGERRVFYGTNALYTMVTLFDSWFTTRVMNPIKPIML